MNKFKQDVFKTIDENTVLADNRILRLSERISTLHDKEMIEFAEWAHENCVRLLYTNPQAWAYNETEYTTSKLLTIFRNQQK